MNRIRSLFSILQVWWWSSMLYGVLICSQSQAQSVLSHQQQWDSLLRQLDVFESSGDFAHEDANFSGGGAFRWSSSRDKFFCDLRFNESTRGSYRNDRVTLLCDGERIAKCSFSPTRSKGCEIKIYDKSSSAYTFELIPYFFVYPEKFAENFLPPIVRGKVSGSRGTFDKKGYSWAYVLDEAHLCGLAELVGSDAEGRIRSVEKQVFTDKDGRVGLKSKSYESREIDGTIRMKCSIAFERFTVGEVSVGFTFDDLEAPPDARLVINDHVNQGVEIRSQKSGTRATIAEAIGDVH